MLNKNVEKNIRIMFPENAEDRTQRILKRLRDDKAKDEHVPGSLTWIGRCAVDHAAADLIEQLGTDVENLMAMLRDSERTNAKRVAKELSDFINDRPRWISVEERLPERDKDVLCFFRYPDSTTVCQNVYYGNGHWLGEGSFVTHWMPIPQPPEEPA